MMDGKQSPPIDITKTVAEWVESTVRPIDTIAGRSGWALSPLKPYAERYKQYVVICSALNASNVAGVPLRLYADTEPKKPRGGKAIKSKPFASMDPRQRRKKLAHLTNPKAVGTKAANYAAYADDSITEVISHPALDLIRKPNDWMSGPMLVEWIASSLEVFGNAFIYATSDRPRGKPDTLLPLLGHYTRIVADPDNYIRGYWYGRNHLEPRMLPPETVMHFKHRPNPLDPFYGLSPLSACLVEADLASNATVAEWYRWKNGGRPDFVVKSEQPLTAEQRQQIRAEVESYTRGTAKSGNFMVMSQCDIEMLGFAPKEMEYLAGLNRSDEVVWNAFGVPQSLVKLNDANLASSETGHVQYYKLTINPRCARIAETLTDCLLPMLGYEPGSLWFAFDDAAEDSEHEEAVQLTTLVNAGVMTIDELRAEQGLDPLPNGMGEMPRYNGTPLDKVGQTPDPLSGLFGKPEDDKEDPQGEPTEEDAKPEDKPEDDAEPVEKSAPAYIVKVPDGLGFYGAQVWHEHHITKDDKLANDYHSNPIVDKAGRKFYDDLNAYYRDAVTRILDDGPMSDLRPSDAGLMGIVNRNIHDLFQAGLLNGFSQMGRDLSQGELPMATAAQISRFVAPYVPKLAMSISSDVQSSIKNAIIDGLANGLPYTEVAKQIKDVLPELADWRAERVARTETSRAVGHGQVASWQEAGIEGKSWILSNNACAVCEAIAAKNKDPIPVDQPFAKVGETYAGVTLTWEDVQYGGAAHPNCSCSTESITQLSEATDNEPDPGSDAEAVLRG